MRRTLARFVMILSPVFALLQELGQGLGAKWRL